MKLETSFNIGDTLWANNGSDVERVEIKKIEMVAWKDSQMILYVTTRGERYYEEDLFETKSEALYGLNNGE